MPHQALAGRDAVTRRPYETSRWSILDIVPTWRPASDVTMVLLNWFVHKKWWWWHREVTAKI